MAIAHPIGAFCFVELLTPDPAASARFYGDLFGWRVREESTDYFVFHVAGSDVAGMRRADGEQRWVAYIHVDDVNRVASGAAALGATILTPPTEELGRARRAVLRDPEGAILGLWQPLGYEGTQLVNGPGSLWWLELATCDMAAARDFYVSLFGWDSVHTTKFENGVHGYTLFKVGDRSTAGVFQFEPDWGMSAMWQVYFEVASFDATAANACALGGEQGFWRDAPNAGRLGVLLDPGDGQFLIAQPLPAATSS